MIAAIMLLAMGLLGLALVRILPLRLRVPETAALTIVFGMLGYTWIAFILALAAPYSFSLPASIILTVVIIAIAFTRPTKLTRQPLNGQGEGLIYLTGLAAVTAVYAPLLWSHSLAPGPGPGLYSGGATWGDIGLHASLISHLAYQPRLIMDMPLISGFHLTYPILIDFLSSLLLRGGFSYQAALAIPGLVLVPSLAALIISLGTRLFRSTASGLLALFLVLTSGSFIAITAAWNDWHASGLSLSRFIAHLPMDYTVIDHLNAHYSNLVTDTLLPQRGFWFGLPVTLAIIMLVIESLHQKAQRRTLRIAGALLAGLLPMAHPHSFIVVIFITASLIITDLIKNPRSWKEWLWPTLIVAILAVPQILWQQLIDGNGSGAHFNVGWMTAPGQSIWQFWWQNFGPAGILWLAIGAVLIAKHTLRRFLPIYLPILALIIITNLYSLQTWNYDNLKIILYINLIAMLFAAAGIVHLTRRQPLTLIISIPLIAALSLPGLLSIRYEYTRHDQTAAPDDIAMAGWIQTHSLPGDTFLTSGRPQQPVATLAGRPIVLGYTGWLYTYHISYQSHVADAARMGQTGVVTAADQAKYHIKYVASCPTRDNGWTPEWVLSDTALATHYPIVYQNATCQIYAVK